MLTRAHETTSRVDTDESHVHVVIVSVVIDLSFIAGVVALARGMHDSNVMN